MKSISKYLKNPKLVLCRLAAYGWIPMADEKYIKLIFKEHLGYELNLNNPQTFNEKLQWLKLNDRKLYYTEIVDKCKIKDIICKNCGSEYVIPTLGVWKHPSEIDYDSLPRKFVLKCTHDSGSSIICDKEVDFDKKKINSLLEKALRTNYYLLGREWPYKDVPRRVIAEPYLSDEIIDYKMMCFNGKVKCSFVCTDRQSADGLKVTFLDRDWNKLPFERHYPSSDKKIELPKNYAKMIELSELLAKDMTFVRVDFYEVEGKLYFGELTLYPGDGLEEFTPEEWDYKLGQWIQLTKDVS